MLSCKNCEGFDLKCRISQAKVVSGCLSAPSRRGNASGAPDKIECFVDGKKVLVDPGTTVLQVSRFPLAKHFFLRLTQTS
jgi:hypothetical protein